MDEASSLVKHPPRVIWHLWTWMCSESLIGPLANGPSAASDSLMTSPSETVNGISDAGRFLRVPGF